MGDRSHIEWTDATWNPIAGCSVVSPGCTNCYAMRRVAPRLAANPATPHYAGTVKASKAGAVWTGRIGVAGDATWEAPLRWARPRRIFVNSTSDLFHPDVSVSVIDRAIATMALCPHHDFQVLTKRPDVMAEYLAAPNLMLRIAMAMATVTARRGLADMARGREIVGGFEAGGWPLKNVLMGCSVENDEWAHERWPHMLEISELGWRTFVSYEPALGDVEWTGWEFLDWLISGGESGDGARPSHPDWHRHARDWAAANDIPYLFKQWGVWLEADQLYGRSAESDTLQIWRNCARWRPARPLNFADAAWFGDFLKHPYEHHSDGCTYYRLDKARAGRLLDGRLHDGYPARAA